MTTPRYTLRGPRGNVFTLAFSASNRYMYSSDGKILLHDGRADGLTRAQSTLQLSTEATGVQYHPHMEHIFATSDSNGDVCLRDNRMAFGPLATRARNGVVQRYLTKLTRKTCATLSRAEASSITFNPDGT
ncbi:hypothetical protein C0991_004967 [Blastosporella zonata]|nr:hypothetical protein C0991_004967 [Blastosporella zonata]